MRYEIATDLSPREALQQAVTFFGPGGEGLALTSKRPGSLVFQGGGGHVAITARRRENETILDLETREWDIAVRQFMTRVSRRRHWWQRWRKTRKKSASSQSSTFTILNNVQEKRPDQTTS